MERSHIEQLFADALWGWMDDPGDLSPYSGMHWSRRFVEELRITVIRSPWDREGTIDEDALRDDYWAPKEYRLDFAEPSMLLCVELDGREFHTDRKAFNRDRERDRRLAYAGWHVMRFSADEVILDAEACVAEVGITLRRLGQQRREQWGWFGDRIRRELWALEDSFGSDGYADYEGPISFLDALADREGFACIQRNCIAQARLATEQGPRS